MIYVILLENVVTRKQVYYIGRSPDNSDDSDIIIHFMDSNTMTPINYRIIRIIDKRNEINYTMTDVILEYVKHHGLNDSLGRYNILWDPNCVNNDKIYQRIQKILRNGNPFI